MAEPAAAPPRAGEQEGSPARLLLDAWFGTPDNPIAAHHAVLRLTYGLTPAVVIMAALARLLGIDLPLWLIVFQAVVLMATTWRQERLVIEGVVTPFMAAAHLNLGLLLL
ncbi:MAG: hypothetical protein QN129_12565, partial [Armatimonadota bacterium]|nr:hypothetical protein [Armatimonadota bacterium]